MNKIKIKKTIEITPKRVIPIEYLTERTPHYETPKDKLINLRIMIEAPVHDIYEINQRIKHLKYPAFITEGDPSIVYIKGEGQLTGYPYKDPDFTDHIIFLGKEAQKANALFQEGKLHTHIDWLF